MKVDMLFFLGLFYALFGALVMAGWFISGSVWNLYAIVMLVIGVALIAIRPKPALRFFIGRVTPSEQADVRQHCPHADPATGLPRLRPETEEQA